MIISGFILTSSWLPSMAQRKTQDSVFTRELNEVVVTATRNERKLGNVAVPVTVISQKPSNRPLRSG